MTWALLIVLGAAVLATLALVAWAWVWFAIDDDAPAMFSPGDFDAVHFNNLVPVHPDSSRAPLFTAARP